MALVETQIEKLQSMLPLTEQNVAAFLQLAAEVTQGGDPLTVRPILLLADDKLRLGGVNERLLSLLDDVPVEDFVRELLATLPELVQKSPASAKEVVQKLLWSDGDRAVLGAGARQAAGSSKQALADVLARIKTARLQDAVAEVRQQL